MTIKIAEGMLGSTVIHLTSNSTRATVITKLHKNSRHAVYNCSQLKTLVGHLQDIVKEMEEVENIY